jgi:hypothetical protein
MTYRDLYFATHHEAAHVVTALTLGCRVDFVEFGEGKSEAGWCLNQSSVGDVETICAAGYAMEQLMGRLPEQAWSRSQDDRALMASLHADLTGLALDGPATAERFLEGAEWSRAILNHQTARRAIDALASALSAVYGTGERRMSGADILEITSPIMGASVAVA